MNCTKCNKETTNPKFCSRSCATSYNNSINPKVISKSKCNICGTKILFGRKYCKRCYTNRFKEKNGLFCKVCSKHLAGKQIKFCSSKCQFRDAWKRNYSYTAQQTRGIKRKKRAIELCGGGCLECGYNKNLAALHFHHKNPKTKEFNLDMRRLANSSWEIIIKELDKCDLLCANCHREHHNPNMIL